jgi:hypothetical protein
MKNFSFLLIATLVVALSVTSCKDKSAEATEATPEASATPASGEMTTTVNADGTPAGEQPYVPNIPLTSIKFDKDTYDWGTVMDGETVTHVFKFTNTGKEPLVINNAKGSCGCTVPEWPRDPIAPGKTGEIKVVFDSKGKGAVGGKEDSKRVTITANTDPVDTYLTIKGKIDKKPDAQ